MLLSFLPAFTDLSVIRIFFLSMLPAPQLSRKKAGYLKIPATRCVIRFPL